MAFKAARHPYSFTEEEYIVSIVFTYMDSFQAQCKRFGLYEFGLEQTWRFQGLGLIKNRL